MSEEKKHSYAWVWKLFLWLGGLSAAGVGGNEIFKQNQAEPTYHERRTIEQIDDKIRRNHDELKDLKAEIREELRETRSQLIEIRVRLDRLLLIQTKLKKEKEQLLSEENLGKRIKQGG